MAGSSIIEVTVEGRIARTLLNRPKTLNAINWDFIRQMTAALDELSKNNDVWVAYVEGAGERAFSAGADLKERRELSLSDVKRLRKEMILMFRKVTEFPKPTIAAVHGYALGGGFELALACDIILADETAVFGLTEVSLGIIPGGGGTQTLPRRIGVSRAKELIFTARRINAREAERLGVANRVVPAGQAGAAARDLAKEMAKNAPVSLRQAKRAIDRGAGVPPSKGWEIEEEAYDVTLLTEDRNEALRAFAEKRPPRFKGR
ncbi:MAG: enoyl-CoA hydratase/isomerase family protein [Nitrospinota bacterium]